MDSAVGVPSARLLGVDAEWPKKRLLLVLPSRQHARAPKSTGDVAWCRHSFCRTAVPQVPLPFVDGLEGLRIVQHGDTEWSASEIHDNPNDCVRSRDFPHFVWNDIFPFLLNVAATLESDNVEGRQPDVIQAVDHAVVDVVPVDGRHVRVKGDAVGCRDLGSDNSVR